MIDGVLILAAGMSTRIAARSEGVPKPLLEIGGRPIIEHTLEWLAASGVRNVWINLHYQAETIRTALGDGARFGLAIRYAFEPEILGTAGAWKRLRQEWHGTSLVVYGDNLIRFDLRRIGDAHRASGGLVTAALFDAQLHPNTGIAGGHAALGPGCLVERFVEGSAPEGSRTLVNAGAYFLEPAAADWIGEGFQDFGRDVLPRLAAGRKLVGYVVEPEAFCLGLDTPASFERGEQLLRSGNVTVS